MASSERELLEKVKLAMEQLHGQFEEKINAFRLQGKDPEEMRELIRGELAMKDAAGMYLAWTLHYIERLGQSEKGSSLEMEEGDDA